MGVILGGRLGYVVFYDLAAYLAEPLKILRVWEGGMSFHGGLIGVMLATWLFGRRNGKSFFQLMDFIAPLVPIGLGAGRIGNFINAELWGKVTDVPWAMVFPNWAARTRVTRRSCTSSPSKAWPCSSSSGCTRASRVRPWRCPGCSPPVTASSASSSSSSACRMPSSATWPWNWLTMGQVLCLPMILGGIGLMVWAYRRQAAA